MAVIRISEMTQRATFLRSWPASESIALARKHEEETGEAPALDPDFAADVEEIVRNRKPWNPPTWD
jgi:hypothetical protein